MLYGVGEQRADGLVLARVRWDSCGCPAKKKKTPPSLENARNAGGCVRRTGEGPRYADCRGWDAEVKTAPDGERPKVDARHAATLARPWSCLLSLKPSVASGERLAI